MKLILVLLAAVIVCTSARDKVCCKNVGCFQTDGVFSHLPSPRCPEEIGVSFALFTRANPNRPVYIKWNRTLPLIYDGEKMTMVLVHGYEGSPDSDFTLGAKDEYLKNEHANVILVGWVNGSSDLWYPNSAANTRAVGAEIARVLDRLKREAGASHTNMWCVGLSLGAHTCGFAGMSTQLDRISGLDPAGPWFDGQDEEARINPNTARFVDIIHTDGTGILDHFGMLTPVGDIDFYPNGGHHQPGCITGLPQLHNSHALYCSHFRSAEYFIQSLINEDCFISEQVCTDPHDMPGSCQACEDGEICAKMGAAAIHYQNMTGALYYLETTHTQPFCLNN